MHHLVDPATGRPAAIIWRTVSVSAASCLDANIAATAAIVRGTRAPGWLESLGLPSRLVSRDGSARHLAGWPVDNDDLALDALGHQVLA
jgi:thiamine biosynthesis lipoprotein